MNYYKLSELDDLPNTLIPEFPSASAIWSEAEPIFLKGSVRNKEEYVNFLTLYRSGSLSKAFLVCAEAWNIWREYQNGGRCRPCAFGNISTRQFMPYYLILPKILDALHQDTVFFRDGNIETLCLLKEIIGGNQVFAVKGSTQMELLVSEVILEEMLRKNMVNFHYVQVEVRKG